eukprot:gene9840-11553_t
MSINLSFSNKFKKVEAPAETEEDAKKKNKATKQNPLLNTKTDPYVDDNDAYVPRISRADRYEYWMKLLPNRGPRRPLPKAFVSWKSKEIAMVNEEANYYRIYSIMFNIVKSKSWDHRYINLFIIWILLIVFFVDGWAESMAPFLIDLNTGNQLLAVPPFLMFITQLVPFLGMMYFITHCNDLVHYRAIKEIGSWSFAAALTAQYFEYFLYRGQGHPERAGNCKIGHEPNPRPLYESFKRTINTLRKRNHAKVDSELVHDEDHTQQDEPEPESEPEPETKSKKKRPKKAKKDNNDSASDLENGQKGDKKDGKSEKNPQLKSALKKASNNSDADASGENEEFHHTKSRKKSGNRKNSATIVEDVDVLENRHNRERRRSEMSHTSNRSHRSGDSKQYDEDGNEILPVPHTEWDCIVCHKHNYRPTHGPVDSDIYFGEKGVHYKRTYAVIQARRDVPTCVRCGTYSDYKPPLGSAHLFPHNPEPHKAFTNYPVPSTVQAGMKNDIESRYYYKFKSFFFGIKDDINSAPLKNDWRLEKFVNARFPELPRYSLKPEEFFQVGEIVECRQQKFEWARARVNVVHTNHTYDIRYDPGDEIRFVEERLIRTIPEKRAYAFRVEMGLVVIVLFTPLMIAAGVITNSNGLGFLPALIVSAVLLGIRVVTFVQYFYNYYHAGMIAILKLSALYTLPLLLLLIACIVGLSGGITPSALLSTGIVLILTKLCTLPYLYIYRPLYVVIGGIAFLQTSIGFMLLAIYAANPVGMYVAIPLAPFLTVAVYFKVVRHFLHSMWDVCLIMRKAKDTEFENPSIVIKAKEFVMEYLDP